MEYSRTSYWGDSFENSLKVPLQQLTYRKSRVIQQRNLISSFQEQEPKSKLERKVKSTEHYKNGTDIISIS